MFLRLNPQFHRVCGATAVCLYDTLTGDMISLGRLESSFLSRSQDAVPWRDLIETYAAGERDKLAAFVDEMKAKNMVTEYARPVYQHPFERGLRGTLADLMIPTRLRVFSVEISTDCELDCCFCHPPEIFGRGTGCGRFGDATGPPLTAGRRMEILGQAADLGASELHLTGGDAMLNPEWEEFVARGVELGFSRVIIWTTGLNPIPKKWAADPRVAVLLPVFSARAAVHDRVTGRAGSLDRLTETLGQLRRQGGRALLTLVVTRLNEDDQELTLSRLRKYTSLPVQIAPLYPCGSGRFSPTGPGREQMTVKRWFMRPDAAALPWAQTHHPCFHGRLAVSADGRILPCPVGRSWVLGHAEGEDLHQVLQRGAHRPYWTLSKASLPKCRHCEFRLGCFDCRVIQGRGTSLLDTCFCDYDPHEAGWTGTEAMLGRGEDEDDDRRLP